MNLYPLILSAPLKDYIWGGTRLKEEYNFNSDLDKVSEAWVLSCHPDGRSVITNGPMRGKTLNEALGTWGEAAYGKECKEFPILVKLIDAKDKLSIQVHPNDEYARANEGDNGKTEMWYIVDCEEGAKLVFGFNRDITKEEFRERIQNNTLDEVLNYVPVHKGDFFFIEAGTVHAIGAGILIAEIQENSNVTYRVSDYGRLGADGKPRALHIDKAVEVSKLTKTENIYGKSEFVGNVSRSLAWCEYFRSDLFDTTASEDDNVVINDPGHFTYILVLDGVVTVNSFGRTYSLTKGESVFVPAGSPVSVSGKGRYISVHNS